jgi:glycosyltransferase involved in cell wall biosynthesis
MILGIDATNIIGGGGVTHIVNLLNSVEQKPQLFEKVIIWASKNTLDQIENHPMIVKEHNTVFEENYLKRALWQHYKLGKMLRHNKCDLLFAPGGSFSCDFTPVVSMSQNLLPFEWQEMLRFGMSPMTLKMILLRWSQKRSYRRAEGIIFLTEYARSSVLKVTGTIKGGVAVIPHGLDTRFFMKPRPQRDINEFSEQQPFRILYVSTIEPYKHHWHVVEAIGMLRNEGYPVELELIGSFQPYAFPRLKRAIHRVDPNEHFIKYTGLVPHENLHKHYHAGDLGVFASSCENMPIILMENMASGLPIACSNYGPMPEILDNAGVYFDPVKPLSIAEAIKKMIVSPELRSQKAELAYRRAQDYSWKKCAIQTFGYFNDVALGNNL